MKKLATSILLLAAVLAPVDADARNVSMQEAREAAAFYMQQNAMHGDVKASDLRLVYQFDNENLGMAESYVFNVSDWGWIIMTGSTAAEPVIGYSDNGTIDQWDLMPDNMRWWVEGFSQMVGEIQDDDQTGKFDDMAEWTNLLNRVPKASPKDDPRVILLDSFWEQGENRGATYNLRCPYDSTVNKYTYVGCVATALSQIIRYYGFPLQATGGRKSYSTRTSRYRVKLDFDTLHFDYSLMPVRLNSSSSQAQIDEVARLCFAVGVSVQMDYGVDGSGAFSDKVPTSMSSYFKYETGTMTERDLTTTNNFLNILRNDLMLRRPVYMGGASQGGSGRDAAGHAWVCCGYRTDNEDMYYMNWGWGRAGDGFFNLRQNDMNPSGFSYNFKLRQEHITGIIPPHADSTTVNFLAIESAEGTTVLEAAYPNPAFQSVAIPYSTTTAGEMQIFGIDGKLVATRRLQAGSGRVELSVAGMPAGIYVYRLGGQSGKFIVR